MKVTHKQTEVPQSGRAWITLAMSIIALLVVSLWALQNHALLLERNADSNQLVITDQSESDSELTNIVAEQVQASINPEAAEITSNQATEQVVGNQVPESQEAGKPAAAVGKSDEQQAENKLVDDVAQEPLVEQAAPGPETGKPAESKEALVSELPADEEDAKQLAAANTLTEKLASEKAAVDKALAVKLAAEEQAAEEQAAADKAAEEKAAEEKAADEKVAEDKAAEDKAAEEKAAEDKAAEEKAALVAKLESEKRPVERLATLPARDIPSVSTIAEQQQTPTESETAFEKSRREDLATLSELGAQIRFLNNDTEMDSDSKQSMDHMFELLFLYSETSVTVQVATNEYDIDDSNKLISRLRALVIINYLIERGLDEERFGVRALGNEALPSGSQQVTVVATVIDK